MRRPRQRTRRRLCPNDHLSSFPALLPVRVCVSLKLGEGCEDTKYCHLRPALTSRLTTLGLRSETNAYPIPDTILSRCSIMLTLPTSLVLPFYSHHPHTPIVYITNPTTSPVPFWLSLRILSLLLTFPPFALCFLGVKWSCFLTVSFTCVYTYYCHSFRFSLSYYF